jgi:hypothetical protein
MSEHLKMLRDVARDPDTSSFVLNGLAKHDDPFVRRAVKKNPTYQSLLLAQDPSTPKDVLCALATNKDGHLARSARENPSCPTRLADRCAEVQDAITNLNTHDAQAVARDGR